MSCKEKDKGSTSNIIENAYCKDCGWPIIFSCCNDEFKNFKDANKWDWWVYCSNKGCVNHDGEGMFQSYPDWMAVINKERI